MKANDLVRLIDKLVEKKVENKISQLIKEEVSAQVNSTMGKMLVEMINGSNFTRKDYIGQEVPNLPSPINTNNPRLNSVLAETARNFRPIPKEDRGSLAELLDGGFDKIGSEDSVYDTEISQPKPVVSDGTNVGFLKQIISEGSTTGAPQQSVLGTNAVPDILKGVFKKDFRSVMKKMDEQKKFGSSGLINPQMVLSG
jgi:hypothetical protein